ncbi:MAG: hypothetical protein K8R63_06310 [Bacteroidales bacterium]|nr:hypothetical protein [Bacteroidales bacterium]
MNTFAVKQRYISPTIKKAKPSRLVPQTKDAQKLQTHVHQILRSNDAQAKLTIGQPNDKYEQEADRVADQVMRMAND